MTGSQYDNEEVYEMEFSFKNNQISIQNASAQDLKDFMCFITGFQAEQGQTAAMPIREAVRTETKVPIPAPEPIPVADQPEPVVNKPKKKVGYSSAKKLAGWQVCCM